MVNKGYRSEDLYGEGYRDAASVMAHEIFVLCNTDILDTLGKTIFKNTNIGTELEWLSNMMLGECDYYDIENFLDIVFDNKCSCIDYAERILQHTRQMTGRDIKYVLWLCDSTEDVQNVYGADLQSFDCYETSDIILSNIGVAGKLYGYEDDPKRLYSI